MVRPLSAFILACFALLAPISGAGFGPDGARAMGPLPACRYDNILTSPRAYSDWPITLVDTILRVPSTYVPPDLVPTSRAGIEGGGSIRKIAIRDLAAMTDAAQDAGAAIAVESAYRSYAQQKITFQHWVDALGYAGALKVSARPGHSEHQLGLAIDFRSAPGGPPWNGGDWALTRAGEWMEDHAWEYGWVLSYPKDAFAKVCYSYEPWHYRYVGRSLAAKIHASGRTIRETLWATYTTAVVPAAGAPAPSGSPATTPTASATVEPTTSPAPTPTPTTEPSPTASPAQPLATPSPTGAADPPGPTGILGSTDVLMVVGGLGLLVALVVALTVSMRRSGRR